MKEQIKSFISGFTVAIFLFVFTTMAFAKMEKIEAFFNDIKISINGKIINTGNDKPFIYNGRTYVPARYIAEELGATVEWNESSNCVEIDNQTSTTSFNNLQDKYYNKVSLYNGDVFEGIFNKSDDSYYFGQYLWKNGDTYVGYYNNGKRNNIGVYYMNSSIYTGKWNNNVLESGISKDICEEYTFVGEVFNDVKLGKNAYFYNDGICALYNLDKADSGSRWLLYPSLCIKALLDQGIEKETDYFYLKK